MSSRRRIELPQPARGDARPLWELIAARRSVREFGRRPLREEELSALLWSGQGITSATGGRAAPSAGALHPITLSLADHRGVFRYLPVRAELEEVAAEDRRSHLAAAALGQEVVAEAAATLVVTAEPSVLARRYHDRAERYCILEAGHVAQNVLLQATALGLAAVPVAAFHDDEVLAAVALGPGHLALYLVAVGPRRPG